MKTYRKLLLALAASALTANAAIISNFTSSDEGWTGVTANVAAAGVPTALTGLSVTYSNSGGNPGGYIRLADADNNSTFFRAPSAFLGNQSGSLHANLSFQWQVDQTPDWLGPVVVIKSAGTTLVYNPASSGIQNGAWSTSLVPLTPGSDWHVSNTGGALATLTDFQNVLGNVTELWISAEHVSGVTETTSLDNVTLNQLPEPSTFALVGLGGAAALFLRRRATQR